MQKNPVIENIATNPLGRGWNLKLNGTKIRVAIAENCMFNKKWLTRNVMTQ